MVNNKGLIVTVVGLGYIGLPTAALIASKKIQVHGVDVNPTIVDQVNQGQAHFQEPELDNLLSTVISEGYLQASANVTTADVFIIAVPTPLDADKTPDLSYIHAACRAIASVVEAGNLLILESTSPVGTTEEIEQVLAGLRPDLRFPSSHGDAADVKLSYCPERVLPGRILYELVQNDRVIGGISRACSSVAAAFYKQFVHGKCVETRARTAEMCKLAENSFRDVNIAFANEMSMICDRLDIDVWELIHLANRHPRVDILDPGPGVGGHCIAVDPWFIVHSAPKEAKLISTAREVNDAKPAWVIEKVQGMLGVFLQKYPDKTAKDVTIACLGLTFKADIDDLRESPALSIVESLAVSHPGHLIVVEPNVTELPGAIMRGKAELQSIELALQESDLCLILVGHKEFQTINFDIFHNGMDYVLDLRKDNPSRMK